MTPEQLAENLRVTCKGVDPIELSATADNDIIQNYLRCSCCGECCITSDIDLEFLILQSSNREDFDRNVFLHVHGGPLDADEQVLVNNMVASMTRELLLRLGVTRQLDTIRDEATAQQVYFNLCKHLSQFISDSVNRGFKKFAEKNPQM
jgi:hypothetical protein